MENQRNTRSTTSKRRKDHNHKRKEERREKGKRRDELIKVKTETQIIKQEMKTTQIWSLQLNPTL